MTKQEFDQKIARIMGFKAKDAERVIDTKLNIVPLSVGKSLFAAVAIRPTPKQLQLMLETLQEYVLSESKS